MTVKSLQNLRWLPIFGDWFQNDDSTITFPGRETPTPRAATGRASDVLPEGEMLAFVQHGQIVFNERFTEGTIRASFIFEESDYRSNMNIVLQTNTSNNNILYFGLTGGFIKPELGSGYLFALRRYGVSIGGGAQERGAASAPSGPTYTDLFKAGEGRNLKSKVTYDLEVTVKGAVISASVNEVEVMRHTIDQPSLLGEQVGLFGGSRGNIYITKFEVEAEAPKAFVIMQFNTEEYEALYREVIAPLCEAAGLQPHRGDSTFLPGLIIEDIKRQIEEARIVIAEVSPNNANVYFEVGYADALRKPIILIADRKEGLKPFDVRAYRTLFYDNSIGGKRKVETDLRRYLDSILGK